MVCYLLSFKMAKGWEGGEQPEQRAQWCKKTPAQSKTQTPCWPWTEPSRTLPLWIQRRLPLPAVSLRTWNPSPYSTTLDEPPKWSSSPTWSSSLASVAERTLEGVLAWQDLTWYRRNSCLLTLSCDKYSNWPCGLMAPIWTPLWRSRFLGMHIFFLVVF